MAYDVLMSSVLRKQIEQNTNKPVIFSSFLTSKAASVYSPEDQRHPPRRTFLVHGLKAPHSTTIWTHLEGIQKKRMRSSFQLTENSPEKNQWNVFSIVKTLSLQLRFVG